MFLSPLLFGLLLPAEAVAYGLYNPTQPPTLQDLPPFSFRTHVPVLNFYFELRLASNDVDVQSEFSVVRDIVSEALAGRINANEQSREGKIEELLRVGSIRGFSSGTSSYRVDVEVGG